VRARAPGWITMSTGRGFLVVGRLSLTLLRVSYGRLRELRVEDKLRWFSIMRLIRTLGE
jgi:hypothetical protein